MVDQIKPGGFKMQTSYNMTLLNRRNNKNLFSSCAMLHKPQISNVLISCNARRYLVPVYGGNFS